MGHYEVLGVEHTATAAQVRSAYLALARRYHPDRLSGADPSKRAQAADRMVRVNAAWAVLGDPHKRAVYDLSLDVALDEGFTRTADATFAPYDDGPDEVDPRLLDDTPFGERTIKRSTALTPVVLFAAGGALAGLGMFINIGAIAAVGLALVGVALLSFLAVPLIALVNSSRDERGR